MDAATIEQMNKVRASVGLAPLPVPGQASNVQHKQSVDSDDDDESEDLSTLDKRQAAADGNWQKLEKERLDRIDRQKRKDAAKKARDTAARFTELEGKGLGDEDEGGDLDTRSWLLSQKKRQKKIEQARKLEAELIEREREMQASYTSRDLAGVRVGHELDDFDEMTGEKILTLKDAEIGDDSDQEDELENQDLREQEKLQERLQLKKKRPDYDPTEQSEEKAILSKYDDEINGRKQKRFKLDGQGTSAAAQVQKRKADENDGKPSRGMKISLDMLEDDKPVTDYLDPSSIKVKKPKKKKEKKTRQKAADDDDIPVLSQTGPQAMDVDNDGSNTDDKSKRLELDDDDDLQAKLAEQRRQALKKRKRLDPAEVARQMREEMALDEDIVNEGGLLIDETTEFVANLKKPGEQEDSDDDVQPPRYSRGKSAELAADDDVEMDVDESADRPVAVSAAPATGIEEEETMSGHGLGATAALLRKRGLVKDAESAANAEKERQRTRFLAEKQALIDDFDARAREQREAERKSGKFDRMSQRDREAHAKHQNELREQYLAKLQADMFNAEYKPNVSLNYYDEFGRSMNQKEAFKHLSHSFHGKGSGKQKTEKRLKKIANEQHEMAKGMLNANSESGMSYIQGREGKRTKQAGVRLQ